MEKLIKDEILLDLDLSDFDTCVDCIKSKLNAKIRNAKANRCNEMLWLIHTDICGSFIPPAMGGHKYFIMLINDFSRYGFVGLIREKSESLEAFKDKVELQQGKKIKVVLTEVVSIMVNMMRQDTTLDHLKSTLRNVALMLSIQCLVLLNKIGLRREGISRSLIWCNVCLLIPHYLSSYGGEALKIVAY